MRLKNVSQNLNMFNSNFIRLFSIFVQKMFFSEKFEDVQKLISDGGITNSMLNNALLRTSSLGKYLSDFLKHCNNMFKFACTFFEIFSK